MTHSSITITLSGLDAIERVLLKAKKGGLKDLGHGYKKSVDLEPSVSRSGDSI